jgi:nitrogen-specific signal transduction histidine kinase
MLLPVLEKGRIVAVFVAEWIDPAKKVADEEVLFAERVVARTALARERLLQFEAVAEQAAHARAAHEEVGEALAQLQAVLAALPDAVLGLDADGKITFANRAAARLLQRREFELMGRWISEMATELEADAATWERVMAADAERRFPAALTPSGRAAIDVTVVPGLPSGVCDRLVTLVERDTAAPASASGDGGAAGAIVREIAEPLGRLRGNLELLAAGAYGPLAPEQEEAVEGARRVGSDLHARLEALLRRQE